MSARISRPHAARGSDLLGHAIFGLDRWLRHHQGVEEYTGDPECIFRINRAQADHDLSLADGTSIHAGDPILNLHLWNEHVPPMPRTGATVVWARHMTRALDSSLRELSCCLSHRPDFDDIVALRADMRIGTAAQSAKLVRIVAHYGFQAAALDELENPGRIQRIGENLFMFLLVLATNPAALRTDVFWRDHALVYLARAALERHYGGVPSH